MDLGVTKGCFERFFLASTSLTSGWQCGVKFDDQNNPEPDTIPLACAVYLGGSLVTFLAIESCQIDRPGLFGPKDQALAAHLQVHPKP